MRRSGKKSANGDLSRQASSPSPPRASTGGGHFCSSTGRQFINTERYESADARQLGDRTPAFRCNSRMPEEKGPRDSSSFRERSQSRQRSRSRSLESVFKRPRCSGRGEASRTYARAPPTSSHCDKFKMPDRFHPFARDSCDRSRAFPHGYYENQRYRGEWRENSVAAVERETRGSSRARERGRRCSSLRPTSRNQTYDYCQDVYPRMTSQSPQSKSIKSRLGSRDDSRPSLVDDRSAACQKDDRYRCSYCETFTAQTGWRVVKHVREAHGRQCVSDGAVLSNSELTNRYVEIPADVLQTICVTCSKAWKTGNRLQEAIDRMSLHHKNTSQGGLTCFFKLLCTVCGYTEKQNGVPSVKNLDIMKSHLDRHRKANRARERGKNMADTTSALEICLYCHEVSLNPFHPDCRTAFFISFKFSGLFFNF